VLKVAETGDGEAERARNDNNNLAVTRPVEVQVAPAFLRLENMSAALLINCTTVVIRKKNKIE